jgi:signal peptidase II
MHNYGAAFSFLNNQGGVQIWLFAGLALVVGVFITVWMLRLTVEKKMLGIALSFVLGGAVGNLIDRVLYGYVVDFIDVHVGAWHWPAFNVADSAICLGAVLIVYDALFCSK